MSADDRCPHCADDAPSLDRRAFLRGAGVAAAALVGAPGFAADTASPKVEVKAEAKSSESLVKVLYETLSDVQKKAVCFEWDHTEPRRGLLRSHISNNWRITPQAVKSKFYTPQQQALIREIFNGLIQPDWVAKFDKQLKDDMGGFGVAQGIAIFGKPGDGKFEFVLSGRHGTVRCDGNSNDHVCFGGPMVYGHAASGYFEKSQHPGNVFWHQAEAASQVYKMLDGKQRKLALLAEAPDEARIPLRGPTAKFDGIPVAELSADQKEHVQKVLKLLIEPYRQTDRDEVTAALKKQGGLDKCSLAFYQADNLGDDDIWDNWRLEGPAFVWHYRGAPHVHVWVNVADETTVPLNAKNLSGALRK